MCSAIRNMLALRGTSVCLQQAFGRLISSGAQARFMRQQMDPKRAMLPEDTLILLDNNDVPIGEASKTDCHLVSSDGHVMLHRAFSVFLFNSKGDLLLQKRATEKVTYPDHYTNTCCSHPLSTLPVERIEENAVGIRHAAQRRLQWELGIHPDQAKVDDIKYVTRIHYMDRGDGTYGEHEIDYILFLQKDVDLDPNPAEVSEVKYIKRDELDSFLSNINAPLTPWFTHIAQFQLKTWWDNLHQLHKVYDHKTIHRYV